MMSSPRSATRRGFFFKAAEPIGFRQLAGRQRWEKKEREDYSLELLVELERRN